MTPDGNRYEMSDEQIQSVAESLGLQFAEVKRIGSEGNMAGIESDQVLFSRRLDSRTFFVQDKTFGPNQSGGVFEGPNEELIALASSVMERLALPDDEIAEQSILGEQGQVGHVEPETGGLVLEDVEPGKRLALFTRGVEDLPVWSSNLILGATRFAGIGFLQIHWPEIPPDVLDRARKLAVAVDKGWRAPEREGAAVESMAAGIIHSPALGFVMDVAPAIRVVYETLDKTIGRKLTLYLDADGNDVPMPRQFEKLEEEAIQPRVEPVAPPEVVARARSNFKTLLLANPNYFGTLEDFELPPQLPIQLDTAYEEIGCVGYEPELRRLEAVVYIKRETGYGGGICSEGTLEFVRFYLSFDNGATWQDQGMGSFAAQDIPGSKPLEYDVSLQIDPRQRFCTTEVLPLVRAILSWNNPPPRNAPGFSPVWGEVQEARIQISPRQKFFLGDLLEQIEFLLPEALRSVVDLQQELSVTKAKILGVSELHELYAGGEVPGHRYLFPEISKLTATQSLLPPFDIPGTVLKPALLELELDLAEIIGVLLQTDGDTTFEGLACVGLNPNEDSLIGILNVKLSSGYSGNLCTAGSKEFVSFWADFGSGWAYQGTTSVDVHDLAGIGPEGLQYAVFLPVDLSGYRRPCEKGPVTARVRAILSWQAPPPPGDPDFVPTWGDRQETTIHIKPGPVVVGQIPFLSALGDIPESQIGAEGKATGSAIHTGFVASDSPFGGRITVAGHISNSTAGLKYRVVRKPHGAPDIAYVPLVNEPGGLQLIVNAWDPINGWVQIPTTVHADGGGYYPFEDYSPNHSVEGDIVGRWFSTIGEDGQTYDLRIDLNTDGNPAHDLHSNVVAALVDNSMPVAELDIDLGTGVQCAEFALGTAFTGTYSATDAHFRTFQFEIQPSGPPNDPPHGVLPAPPSGTSAFYGGAIGDPGVSAGSYTLDTGGNPPETGPMDACGYALILHVWDRTNVNSGGGTNYSKVSVGYCLQAPE